MSEAASDHGQIGRATTTSHARRWCAAWGALVVSARARSERSSPPARTTNHELRARTPREECQPRGRVPGRESWHSWHSCQKEKNIKTLTNRAFGRVPRVPTLSPWHSSPDWHSCDTNQGLDGVPRGSRAGPTSSRRCFPAHSHVGARPPTMASDDTRREWACPAMRSATAPGRTPRMHAA